MTLVVSQCLEDFNLFELQFWNQAGKIVEMLVWTSVLVIVGLLCEVSAEPGKHRSYSRIIHILLFYDLLCFFNRSIHVSCLQKNVVVRWYNVAGLLILRR